MADYLCPVCFRSASISACISAQRRIFASHWRSYRSKRAINVANSACRRSKCTRMAWAAASAGTGRRRFGGIGQAL